MKRIKKLGVNLLKVILIILVFYFFFCFTAALQLEKSVEQITIQLETVLE